MKSQPPDDLSQFSLLELFRVEADEQMTILTHGLLELERAPRNAARLETLMRAAHSLKGAARIVNQPRIVSIAHALEDGLVAAQQGKIILDKAEIDALLHGVDLIQELVTGTAVPQVEQKIQNWLDHLATLLKPGKVVTPVMPAGDETAAKRPDEPPPKLDEPDRMLRLTAENLNRLLALAGESLVESRWLRPFADSMQRLKRLQDDTGRALDGLRGALNLDALSEHTKSQFSELYQRLSEGREFLGERLQELDAYDRRAGNLSQRLYLEVLRARMRPFGDGTVRFPRMVRDLAHSLGKRVKLEIIGDTVQIDRDILERLDAPLTHLLRNAVDHGCETPEVRQRAGKSPEAVVRLEARHSAGTLLVTITDDGAGIDPERVRQTVVRRQLAPEAIAEKLTESELLEFLFLPGFTLRETVTEISGRGIGLDVVQNMIRSVRGTIRAATQPGRGTRFQMQLPITLSVLRTLLVEIGGEPFAFPLSHITRTIKLPRERVQSLEGRHHFRLGDDQVGLLTAHQLFDCGEPPSGAELPVVVVGERNPRYGLVVDRLLGERELVVQPLDPRLGKVQDISAAALMEDGAPVLIVDVDDLIHSIGKLISGSRLNQIEDQPFNQQRQHNKRILVVDDSLTVRELERKLLTGRGYSTDIAVDGMDAWNALRSGKYDLMITDVDMPKLDGVELTTLIRRDAKLRRLPVMIVSYKDREEEKLRGLNAGADYYLTKGSFDDATLIEAVVDLIGEPNEE